MRRLRLYSPALVLAAWALIAATGGNGDGLTVCGLIVTAAAVAVSITESLRGHGNGRLGRT